MVEKILWFLFPATMLAMRRQGFDIGWEQGFEWGEYAGANPEIDTQPPHPGRSVCQQIPDVPPKDQKDA